MKLTYGELFAGVSGMGLGFDLAGMLGRWRVEIDRSAAGVLAHHDPAARLHADVVAFAKWLSRLKKHDPKRFESYLVSVIGGGSPCQDLSVAGLRAGLDGERSGLFRIMVRICRILRPRIVVWENVLGALSSNAGKDFACVVGAFTGCIPAVPDDGWGYGGFARAASSRGWHVAWRVLDSEYFGVPQRRYRVFLVASAGDGSCAEILFEPESVRGDNPPSREPGQSAAGTPAARPAGSGGLGTDMDLDGGVVAADVSPFVAGTVSCKWAKGTGGPAGNECQNLVAHTLRAEGFDASEDGTGRGTPLVVAHLNGTDLQVGDDRANTLSEGNAKQPDTIVAFSCKDSGADAGEVSPTLRAMGHAGSHANAGGQVAVAFNWQAAGNQTTLGASTESAATLSKSTTQAVAFNLRGRDGGAMPEECEALSVRASSGGSSKSYVATSGVRRLTPRECERLQGWPDDHTRFRVNLKRVGNDWCVTSPKPIEQADGPRYRQAGNGITATVSAWIGHRIVRFTKPKEVSRVL